METISARVEEDLFQILETMRLHRGATRSEMIIKMIEFSVRAKQVACKCGELKMFDDWPVVNNRCGECGRTLEEEA